MESATRFALDNEPTLYTRESMIDANREDEALIEWLQSAEPGASFYGAATVVHAVRSSDEIEVAWRTDRAAPWKRKTVRRVKLDSFLERLGNVEELRYREAT